MIISHTSMFGDLVHILFYKKELDHFIPLKMISILANKGAIQVYLDIDDTLISRCKTEVVQELLASLNHKFPFREVGVVDYFLGIQV